MFILPVRGSYAIRPHRVGVATVTPPPAFALYHTSAPEYAIQGFGAANYISYSGASGPNLGVGETIIIAYRTPNASATAGIVGYAGTNMGWRLYSNGGGVSAYCHNSGAAVQHIIQNSTYGFRVTAITRLADGTIHSATNGESARTSASAVTYVPCDATASFWIGKELNNGSADMTGHTFVWFAHVPRTATDSELRQWSRVDLDDRYLVQSAIISAASLVLRARDWDGVSSTITPSKGSVVFTITGALSRVSLPGEDLYSLDGDSAKQYWSTLEWVAETTAGGNAYNKRSPWAEFRIQTDATFVGTNVLYSQNGGGLNYFEVGPEGSAFSSPMLLWAQAEALTCCETPFGAGLKNLVVVDGSSPLPTAFQRNSVQSIRVPAGSTVIPLSRLSGATGLVHYGDSISVGTGATASITDSGINQAFRHLRDRQGIEALVEAYPGRELFNDVNTPALQSAFVAKIAAFLNTKTNKIFTTLIGRNDCTYFTYTPTQFRAALVSLFQALTVACPGIQIKAIAPIISGDEATAYNGHTISEFRTATQGAVADLTGLGYSNVVFVDGYPWVSSGNMNGPWHPNSVGYSEFAAGYLMDVMQAPRCAITSPAAGSVLTRGVSSTFSGTIDRGLSVTSASLLVNGTNVGAIGNFTLTATTWSYSYTPSISGAVNIAATFGYANGATATSDTQAFTINEIDYSLPTSYANLEFWGTLKGASISSSYLDVTPDNYTTKTNATVVGGISDPDGGTAAYSITDNSTNGQHADNQSNAGWTGDTIQTGDVIRSIVVGRPGGSTLNIGIGNTTGNGVNVNLATGAVTLAGTIAVFNSVSQYNGSSWWKVDSVQTVSSQETLWSLNSSLTWSYAGTGQAVYVYAPAGSHIARQDQVTQLSDNSGKGRHLIPSAGASRYFRVPDFANGGYWWGALTSGTNKSGPLPNALQDVFCGTFTWCARMYIATIAAGTQDWVYVVGSGSRALKIRRNGATLELFRYNDAAASATVTIATGLTVGIHTFEVVFSAADGSVWCSVDKGTATTGTAVSGALTASHLTNSGYWYANGSSCSEWCVFSDAKTKSECDQIIDGMTARKGIVN